jgi:hypothetical protein
MADDQPLTLRTLQDAWRAAALLPWQRQELQQTEAGIACLRRLDQADVAVCRMHDLGDPLLLGVRHFTTQRFGGCDAPVLGRVVDWLVAEHGLTRQQAKDSRGATGRRRDAYKAGC